MSTFATIPTVATCTLTCMTAAAGFFATAVLDTSCAGLFEHIVSCWQRGRPGALNGLGIHRHYGIEAVGRAVRETRLRR